MTGQVSAYNLVPELLMTLNAWPDEWVLLLNAPVDNALRDLENLGLRNFLENPRLYFSYAASRDVDSMSYILNGVSCGLALYSDMGDTVQFGDNVKLLGRSSGKIATYARHGIPIISNVTGLAKLDIEAFQAGIVVDRISELPQSLSNLDVESMSLNAKRYFTELLDYRLYQDHLMDEIKEILL